jgi:hypothetical protein
VQRSIVGAASAIGGAAWGAVVLQGGSGESLVRSWLDWSFFILISVEPFFYFNEAKAGIIWLQ